MAQQVSLCHRSDETALVCMMNAVNKEVIESYFDLHEETL